jgi:colanic acid/amylovoran biosynthesis glycosyltransferase
VRICFFLHRFPELSQTFVLNQVLWFIERGHDVEVIAARAGTKAPLHAAVQAAKAGHALRRRTTYSNMPESMLARVLKAPMPLLAALLHRPETIRTALDLQRFGWFAATGTLLHSAGPLLRWPRSYDAIIAHFGPEGVIADSLRRMGLMRGPLVTFFHGYDLTLAPRAAGRGMYRSLFETGELFLPISEHGAGILRGLGASPARMRVHHMGVDLARFRPRAAVRPESGSLRVLSVGRLIAKKGFAVGIDAVAAAVRAGVRVEYVIIGDGPERDSLSHRIEELGMQATIRLHGPAGEEAVAVALQDADVLFAPSITAADGDHEGIPMVLMEAMASGVAVLATLHGGIPELVENQVSGLLVSEHDVRAANEALCRLADDRAARVRMGASGREQVARDFNADVQNSRLEKLLGELAASFTRP